MGYVSKFWYMNAQWFKVTAATMYVQLLYIFGSLLRSGQNMIEIDTFK